MLTAARERDLEQMNKALTDCMAVNLQNKREIEDAKIQLMALCQEGVKKKFLMLNKSLAFLWTVYDYRHDRDSGS